jgi:hypothetical protein
MKENITSPNPVFQYIGEKWKDGGSCDLHLCGLPPEPDGNWYFWTETWCDALGPYETEEAADLGLAEYASQL